MNPGMAVRATPVEIPDGVEQGWGSWVTTGVVAAIANARHAYLQQLWVVGAMRLMAIGAVFQYRRVLPQERTTAFGMAGEAVLVDRALNELLRVGSAVRVVTARARHLAFAIRHMRGALQLRAAHLVTPQTEFRLRLLDPPVLGQWSAVAGVRRERDLHLLFHLVAVDAGHPPRLVRAALPEEPVAARVARGASGVLLFDRVIGIGAETQGDGILAATRVNVHFARPVTGFATELF